MDKRRRDDQVTKAAEAQPSRQDAEHLLASPANAQRLLAALSRARRGAGVPQSLEELRRDVGLGSSE